MKRKMFGFSPKALAAGASMIALAGAGFAYALFQDTDYVQGTAQTGTLVVKWQPYPAGVAVPQSPEVEASHFGGGGSAGCTVMIDGTGVYAQKVLKVTVTNAQPGDWCDFEGTLKNMGTLNAKFSGYDVSGMPAELSIQAVSNPDATNNEPEAPGGVGFDYGTPGTTDFPTGSVLGPGKTADAEFILTVGDTAAQGTTYSFTLALNFTQA